MSALITAQQHSQVAAMLQDYFGLQVTRPLLEKVVYSNEELAEEVRTGGFGDTCIRDQIIDAVSIELTGTGWPTYGELDELSAEAFALTLAEKVRQWGQED